MKVNCVSNVTYFHTKAPVFGSQTAAPVKEQPPQAQIPESRKTNNVLWVIGGICAAGLGAVLTHNAGLWGKVKPEKILNTNGFKNITEAREYFEQLGIKTDFRGANNTHLPMLNRIKDNIDLLKKMGVKKEKPDSLTISDWKNREEIKELFNQKRAVKHGEEPPESGYYQAFSVFNNNTEAHILIDSNADFRHFLHEMGHINQHRGLDSFWHAKGCQKHDFVDKQLEILGTEERIAGNTDGIFARNLIEEPLYGTESKYGFPTIDGETRFVYPQGMVDVMQQETHVYDGGKSLCEQIAYVFEGLLKGGKFSDETMLYYDFAGGARIPNLKINGKTYDEYIESLYNTPELIQKLRNNVKILKL